MLDFVPSQQTTVRWDVATDVERFTTHGFDAIAAWRPKLSDLGLAATAEAFAAAGVRVSSVHWAGGFTGGDGRSFAESVTDALEAVEAAERLGAPVVVVHSGCRGGHTRAHAVRLVTQALDELAPAARRAGVVLALKPLHADAATGLSFLTRLEEALAIVEHAADPCVRLALDLWHFADAPGIEAVWPRLAETVAIVQAADRRGPPTPGGDRLPPGRGDLPLTRLVDALAQAGYRGDIEVDPVGETVEAQGYDATLRDIRRLATGWAERLPAAWRRRLETPHAGLPHPHRPAGTATGSRRSHASSQVVSPR